MTSEAISETRGHKKSLVRFVVLAGLPVIHCALQRRDVSTQTAGHQPPFVILLVGVLWLLLSGLQQTPLETSARAVSAENGSSRSALAAPAAEASDRRGALLSSDDWPGFRGSTNEGRSGSSLPTHWSSSSGVRWKTALPGRGHSSPIVAGNHVYVTTAYVARGGQALETSLRLLLLTLIVCVVSLAARIATRWLTTNPVSSLPGFLWLYAAVTALVALGAIAIGGEALFDFARCDIRGWLGSSVFATICLALAVTGTRRRVLRIATAGVTLAFAAVVLAAVPSQEHAYLGGLQGMNAKVMIVAALLPAILGAVVIWNTFAGSVARRRGAIAAIVAIVVGGLAAGLLVWRMTLVPADTLPQTNRLEPLLGGVWLLGLPLLSIALVGAARMKASSTGWRLTLVVLAAMSGLLTLYAATEQIAVRVPYLAYQLGTPRVDPWPDTRLLAVLGVVLAVDAALVIRRAHGNKASAGAAPALRLFRLTTASIAVVYFGLINFVHGHQEMIRAIVAIDRDSGGIDWVAEGLRGPQEPVDGRNSPATPTPVTDAEHVCAYFGNHGLMCVNTTGRVKWSRTDVGYNGYYGVGFSPILSDGLLVLASDMPDGLVQISALDVRTGRIAWRREARGPGSTSGNSRTPLVKRVGGVTALIVWGIDGVRAFNLSTGEELWRVPLAGEVDLVASMISDADNLYLSDRTGTARLHLSRIAEGRDPLVWRSKVRSNCASPVLCKRLLLTVTDNGIATALRADTGEIAWRQRLDGNYFASPVASPEAVYFTNDEGMTTVAACEDVYREIARNDIAEPMIASLAASRGHLFARTASHLFSLRPD